jgi:hypothetical protein
MSGFKIEGLKIRYREKSINEISTYSNQLENSIDVKEEPHIFLHTDGDLYVKDNTSLDPINISKFKTPFNSLVVRDGILYFIKNDGTEELSLSELTANKSSIVRDNSLIFSKSKTVDIPSINILDKIRSYYFEENGTKGVDISASNTKYSNVVGEISGYNNTVLDKFNNSILRSNSATVRDTYLNSYVSGYTVNEVAVSGISGEYYAQYDNGIIDSPFDSFPVTLRPLSNFLNEDMIGFDTKDTDLPSKNIFGGNKLQDFKNYLYSNLEKYDGTYSFLSSIFGELGYTGTTFSVSTSGEDISGANIGNFDNGYTTQLGGDKLESGLNVDAGGLFSTLTYSSELQSKLLKSMSLSISSLVQNKVSDIIEVYFRDIINILPDTGTNDDVFPTSYGSEISIIALVNYVNTELSTNNATIKTDMDTVITESLSDSGYSYNLNNREIIYGGVTNSTRAMVTPIHTLNTNWFDLEDMYISTNRIDNKKAVSCTSNFSILVKESKVPLTIEFRLYESMTGIALDTSRIQTIKENSKSIIGSLYNDRSFELPIELNYIGPITQYTCNEGIDDILSDVEINVGEHIRLRSTSNCANEICLTDEGSVLKQIVDDLFIGSESEIIKQNESKINVPRIFKVQWRVIAPSNHEMPQIEDFDVFEIIETNETTMSESTISLSIFSIGDTSGKRSVIKGTKTLDNANGIQVLFERAMPNTDYSIGLTQNKNVSVWADNKTTNGFTIYADKKINCEVNWIASFQPSELSLQKTSILPSCFVDNIEELGNKSNFTILKQEGFL